MRRKRPIMPIFVFERRWEIEVEEDLLLAGELFVDFNRQSLSATIERLLARAKRGMLPEDGFVIGWRGGSRSAGAVDDQAIDAWLDRMTRLTLRINPCYAGDRLRDPPHRPREPGPTSH
jgi:hypothetical protein